MILAVFIALKKKVVDINTINIRTIFVLSHEIQRLRKLEQKQWTHWRCKLMHRDILLLRCQFSLSKLFVSEMLPYYLFFQDDNYTRLPKAALYFRPLAQVLSLAIK